MRNTKLALMIGLAALVLHGCGDDGGGGSKKDGGADAPSVLPNDASTATSTSTLTSTVTQTRTQTSTTTATGTSLDGSAGPDATRPPVDGGAGSDGPLVPVPIDGGLTLDGAVALDGGPALDGGARIDSAVADGSALADVPVNSDSPTAAGKCDYPSCFADLVKDCSPAGACVQQSTPVTGGLTGPWTTTVATCHDNGVKMQLTSTYSIDLVTAEMSGTTTTTWKKPAGVCFSLETAYSSATLTSVNYVIKNAAGATVGTMVADIDANTQTITCTGAAPVVLPLDCDASDADGGSGAECTAGACTF